MHYIKKAFQKFRERDWPRLFIACDLHETIITPTWSRLNEGAEFYPGAVEVLQNWTRRRDICLILWSPLHEDALADIKELMAFNRIKFDCVNENCHVPTGDLCCFEKKWYFDILLEDKAGFEAEKDWFKIKETLIEIGEWE